MKKTLSLIIVSAMIVSAGVALGQTPVYSKNAVGYAKVTLPTSGLVMKAVNFNKVGGTSMALLDLFGTTQLAQSDDLAVCDRVTIWNAVTQTYQTWAQWTDGKFYKANNATEWNYPSEGNPTVAPGAAMWIARGSGVVAPKDVFFMGEVVADASKTLNLQPGLQMLGYPLTADIALQDTAFAASGAAKSDDLASCDRITVWLGNGYQTYALWTDNLWYKANNATEWNNPILASNSISITEGFWYNARNALAWVETNKYLGNLR